MPTDIARLFQTSAEGGHAGPGSSWAYIHLVEEPMAHWLRRARPDSWSPAASHALDAAIFPDIGAGVLLPALADPPPRPLGTSGSTGTMHAARQLATYGEIARRLVAGEDVEEIAGHCLLEPKPVRDGICAIARALVDAGLAEEESLSTLPRQVSEIWRRRTWIAASTHAKLAPISEATARLVADDRPGAAAEVWNAWLRSVDDGHLRLDRSRPASMLIRFLLKAGVPRASMAVTSAQQALPLPPHLAQHKLAWRRCKPRPGAPKYRLALVARHLKSSGGKGRQVSVKGLNWLFVLTGAVVLSREK